MLLGYLPQPSYTLTNTPPPKKKQFSSWVENFGWVGVLFMKTVHPHLVFVQDNNLLFYFTGSLLKNVLDAIKELLNEACLSSQPLHLVVATKNVRFAPARRALEMSTRVVPA